jgi:hypothetical protein
MNKSAPPVYNTWQSLLFFFMELRVRSYVTCSITIFWNLVMQDHCWAREVDVYYAQMDKTDWEDSATL